MNHLKTGYFIYNTKNTIIKENFVKLYDYNFIKTYSYTGGFIECLSDVIITFNTIKRLLDVGIHYIFPTNTDISLEGEYNLLYNYFDPSLFFIDYPINMLNIYFYKGYITENEIYTKPKIQTTEIVGVNDNHYIRTDNYINHNIDTYTDYYIDNYITENDVYKQVELLPQQIDKQVLNINKHINELEQYGLIFVEKNE